MARLATVAALIVHCDATPPTHNWTIEKLRAVHKQRGFNDVGYHFYIRRDGSLYKGRSVKTQGAHCVTGGWNRKSLGICMAGGVDSKMRPEDNFTPAQFNTLLWLLEQLKVPYPKADVFGHRDTGANKACPSFDVKKFLAVNRSACPTRPAIYPQNLFA